MKHRLFTFSLVFLVVALLLFAMPPPQAEAYYWKDSWIGQLKDELECKVGEIARLALEVAELQKVVEHKDRKIANLTFELGKPMPTPAIYVVSKKERRDCREATLYMFYYFKASGYEVDLIVGDLERVGETRGSINHIWVLVHSGNQTYPYDLGYYQPDEQHFEGFIVSYKQLLYWVVKHH